MVRIAHNPAGTLVVTPFSVFAARFILAVLAASVGALLALHTLAPGSAATAPANDESAATSQWAPQPPTYFSGKPY
jgi:hypothetical protein